MGKPKTWRSRDGERMRYRVMRIALGDGEIALLKWLAAQHEGWTLHDAMKSAFWEGLENVADRQRDETDEEEERWRS